MSTSTPVCSFCWHILSPPQPCFRLALCCFPQKLIAQPSDLCVRPCAPTAPAARTPASACPLSLLLPSRNPFFNVISDGQNNHSHNYRTHSSLLCAYSVYNIIAILDGNRVEWVISVPVFSDEQTFRNFLLYYWFKPSLIKRLHNYY